MSAKYWAAPKPGDIVQCRFPQDAFSKPGPKERPALVTRVESFDDGVVDVDIAYGTSQHLQSLHAGEFLVPATDNEAGLSKDTKFDLGNIVHLPFTTEWFAPSPNRRYGEHPKRGRLRIDELVIKRRLQAAVQEARSAGRRQSASARHLPRKPR